jgi:undecaprenyl-diphosphatase
VVWLVNPALKALLARPRPDVTELPGHLSEHSFPSGHAANSAVVVGAAVLIVASWRGTHRIVSLALGAVTLIVVATAQLALGRHYPSDIVAGWLLAAAVLATAAGLMRSTDDFR